MTEISCLPAADECGITCNQSHAPFPSHRPGNDIYNAKIIPAIEKSLKITSMLGGKICVVHPWNDWSPEENAQKLYLPLLPVCKKYNVKIGVENMWNWPAGSPRAICCACSNVESFTGHLSLLDPDWFVACLDLGHAEMMGNCVSAVRLIEALGDRLQALHVHDNNLLYDLHTIPYFSEIKWDDVLEALKRNHYSGDFTYEADSGLVKFPDPLRPAALKFMETIGRYMISRITG